MAHKIPPDEKRCTYVFPPDDERGRAGRRCTAWRWEDTEFCFFHHPDNDPTEIGAKGGEMGGYRKIKPIKKPSDADDYIIAQLEGVIDMLNDGNRQTPEVARALTQALSTLDRAIDRREARGANTTKIIIEYVNDWRNAEA